MTEQREPYITETSLMLSEPDQLAYSAYLADCTFQGKQSLPWELLPEREQRRYGAIANVLKHQYTPGAERIQRYLEALPEGLKKQTIFGQSLNDGLLYPSIIIRFWHDLASETDDGRPISSSGSYWLCIAATTMRQYAGMLMAALYQYETRHYEAWSVYPYSADSKPNIIDHEPALSDERNVHGKRGRYTEITEQDVRAFAVPYVLDYFSLHPSNHRFVEILACGPHNDHHANWACRVKFSAKGDIVTLLITSTSRGLEVFSHRYEE